MRTSRVIQVVITNVPSFADKLAVPLEVAGLGTLIVDTAYGGDSFVIVDAQALGFEIVPDEARALVATGMKITAAANEQLGFQHPVHAEWKHLSFCQFAGPLARENGVLVGSNAVCIRPGKIDRSPTGTGCSARMAVLHAQGRMQVGDRYRARSIIGSEFECASSRWFCWAKRPRSYRPFQAGPGSLARINSCSTRAIHGPKGIGSPTPGQS